MTSENIIKYEIKSLFGIICLLTKNKTLVALIAFGGDDIMDKHKNVTYLVTGANVDSRDCFYKE